MSTEALEAPFPNKPYAIRLVGCPTTWTTRTIGQFTHMTGCESYSNPLSNPSRAVGLEPTKEPRPVFYAA